MSDTVAAYTVAAYVVAAYLRCAVCRGRHQAPKLFALVISFHLSRPVIPRAATVKTVQRLNWLTCSWRFEPQRVGLLPGLFPGRRVQSIIERNYWMPAIADSAAIFDSERMLAQHQAALTLLQGMLSNPSSSQVRWLDLASGKGQILGHLKKNLSDRARAKLQFVGYDIDNHHTRQAERIAESMDLAKSDFGIGELADFHRNEKTSGPWDFITLTNTVHEVSPKSLASILMSAMERLEETGCLFVYDMDRLSSPELGAVLWTGSEFSEVLTTLCTSLGCQNYEPAVGTWTHRSCDGWNAQIKPEHMQLPGDWRSRAAKAVDATSQCIKTILELKLAQTQKVLEVLTRFGAETGEEAADKERLLFDFWAITRALEVEK